MVSIKVSKKHGVNPCMVLCFYCQKENGEIALLGQLPDDAEAPRTAVINREPCTDCKKLMEVGIVLISVNENLTTDRDNPYRTGGWVVVTEEGIRRIITDEQTLQHVVKKRMAFVPDAVWDALGLPRGPLPEEASK